MRSLILLFISVLSCALALAQEYTVQSFEIVPNDLSARTKSRVDYNGKKCALVKVYTDDKIAEAQGPVVGEIGGSGMEKWVYLTHDAKEVKLIFERHLPLHIVFMDYNYPNLTGQMTYVLKLKEVSDSKLGSSSASSDIDAIREKAVKAYKDEDYKTAYKLFSTIPDDKEAQNYIGLMFTHGRGVKKNDSEAMAWYRKSAEQGYTRAQCNLATMYVNAQKYNDALDWFSKAAAQGSSRAQFCLGGMYELGQGVEQDYNEALNWYLKAANQGNARAQYRLGVMYELGEIVEQDYAKAISWYSKAAEQGSEYAQEALERLGKR